MDPSVNPGDDFFQYSNGGWLMSAIIGCQADDLYDGMRVGVAFHPVSDSVTLPYFSPLDSV